MPSRPRSGPGLHGRLMGRSAVHPATRHVVRRSDASIPLQRWRRLDYDYQVTIQTDQVTGH